jgi:dipeptidase E
MRLYLSSFRIGNYPQRLIGLMGDNKKACVIANAVDHKDGRQERLQKEIDDLNKLGFQAEELDLREYFGKEKDLENKLSKYGIVWVRGGNCFVLKRAFEQSGFDVVIKNFLKEDKIVYGGYSAGVCIVSPNLHGTEIVDDPNVVPLGYESNFNWDGLHLIDYVVSVHYKSDHPESADVDKEVEYFIENKINYKTLRDGEVIVVDSDKEEILTV